MKAKKSYGQHFLTDVTALDTIVDTIQSHLPSSGMVVEIGPGKGALTKPLQAGIPSLKAIEADSDMVDYLRKHNILDEDHIIYNSVLDVNPEVIFEGKEYALVGNFPYNISTEIIFWMLGACANIPVMVGMFQKEVAERLIASEGSKKYGVTSVLLQLYYSGRMILELPPESFDPPPRVNSAVILLERKEAPRLPKSQKVFRQVVKLAFGQRRKKLSNSLKSMVADRTIFDQEIFNKRPEHLSIEEFINLADLFYTHLNMNHET